MFRLKIFSKIIEQLLNDYTQNFNNPFKDFRAVAVLILCLIQHKKRAPKEQTEMMSYFTQLNQKLSLKEVCFFPILFLDLFLKLLSEIQFPKITNHFFAKVQVKAINDKKMILPS